MSSSHGPLLLSNATEGWWRYIVKCTSCIHILCVSRVIVTVCYESEYCIKFHSLGLHVHVHVCTRVCDIGVCAHRVIAVVFQKRIVVLDAGSFENKFVIRSKPVPSTNTYALV